jgi:hypothetical protein
MKSAIQNKVMIVLICVCGVASNAIAQPLSDSTRRNTIKLDLTSYWLYRNAIVFSYERVMKPYQTFAVTAGIQEFPNLDGVDSVDVTRETRARGYKFGAEYRFYLKKENKFAAPRGVFIGPYFTIHHYKNTRDITVDTDGVQEFAELVTNFNIINIGVQLGYQFVLNDRWTIDLVLVGPSLSNYRLQMDLEGNYTFDPEDVKNDVVKAMINKFPALEELLNDETVNESGKMNTWAYGYRYQLQIGYRFGRKNK